MGDPQKSYRVIHLTGTNGKTSTTRMVERILREMGLRTGRFTSPHLVRLNERIALDGEPVSDQRLFEVWEDIAPVLEIVDAELEAAGDTKLTFFEALAALGFAVFADAPVDVLVLEVGMGGEWDSTNVADGDVAVFTPISIDHAERLGNTVAEIAKTKSGIIKTGAYVISSPQTDEALPVLVAKAAEPADHFAIFGTLVSFGLKIAAPELVWAVGLSLAVVMILTPAVLGRPGGYIFGSALQVVVLFISIWTIFRDPAGYVFLILSFIFIGLWAWAMIAGSTIDAAKRALKRQNEQLGENND